MFKVSLVILSFAACSVSRADQADFLTPFIQRKNDLKQIPRKTIPKTLYCGQMELMIDQAEIANKLEPDMKIDRIVVSKSRKKMYLLSNRELVGGYEVAFGFGYGDGAKIQSGDGRTPEGIYEVDFKNARSKYSKALHLSYPNDEDKTFADKYGVDVGDSIMIHGFPKLAVDGLDPLQIPQIHPEVNWTQGCVAVTSSEIQEIYNMVDEGVTVEICPLDEANSPQLKNDLDQDPEPL